MRRSSHHVPHLIPRPVFLVPPYSVPSRPAPTRPRCSSRYASRSVSSASSCHDLSRPACRLSRHAPSRRLILLRPVPLRPSVFPLCPVPPASCPVLPHVAHVALPTPHALPRPPRPATPPSAIKHNATALGPRRQLCVVSRQRPDDALRSRRARPRRHRGVAGDAKHDAQTRTRVTRAFPFALRGQAGVAPQQGPRSACSSRQSTTTRRAPSCGSATPGLTHASRARCVQVGAGLRASRAALGRILASRRSPLQRATGQTVVYLMP